MTRTANEVGMPDDSPMPEPGMYECQCVKTEQGKAATGTSYVELTFETNGTMFKDKVYCTDKAIQRLNLVAQRLCSMPPETELPDGDQDAARFLARYIQDNAQGCWAKIRIEENEEKYIIKKGERIGQEATKMKRKVAFGGYESLSDMPSTPPAMPAQNTPQGPPTGQDGAPINEPPSGPDIPFMLLFCLTAGTLLSAV